MQDSWTVAQMDGQKQSWPEQHTSPIVCSRVLITSIGLDTAAAIAPAPAPAAQCTSGEKLQPQHLAHGSHSTSLMAASAPRSRQP